MRTIPLRQLFAGLQVSLPDNLQSVLVTQVHYDSRRIKAGGLFIAIRGFKTDGHQYLNEAKKAGAVAAVVEELHQDIPLPQIVVDNSRQVMAQLVYNFYKPEIESLILVGITGTNGKTTTAFLSRSIFEAVHIPAGLIGTIYYHIGDQKTEAWNTTPEAPDLYEMLFQMTQQGQKAGVLEVSSHALELHRVHGLQFDVAVFTNFSRDHLDFHKNEEAYFQAKAKLFSMIKPGGIAVVGLDDHYGKRLINMLKKDVMTFGFSQQARVRVLDWKMDLNGMNINLLTPVGEMSVSTSLIGAFNAQNIMAAVAVGLGMDMPAQKIIEGIEALEYVPGRLQSVPLNNNALAVVDYSHTPDSLQKALQTLRQLTQNRLIVVFGCGGDRDKGKRPLMGKIAEDLADYVIITSDNPRSEDPQVIIADILKGMDRKDKRETISDRAEAIGRAISLAEEGDVILVAGKGHETYQEIMGRKHHFDDIEVIKEAARYELN